MRKLLIQLLMKRLLILRMSSLATRFKEKKAIFLLYRKLSMYSLYNLLYIKGHHYRMMLFFIQ